VPGFVELISLSGVHGCKLVEIAQERSCGILLLILEMLNWHSLIMLILEAPQLLLHLEALVLNLQAIQLLRIINIQSVQQAGRKFRNEVIK